MTEIIVALIGLGGVLVTSGFGFYQWRRTHLAATALKQLPAKPPKLTRTEEKALGQQRDRLLDRLTDDMRHITLLNRAKPLNIESLYVQLRVHDQQPMRYMHQEEIQELARRELSDLIRLTRARKKERQTEVLTPEEALARFRRIAVLGDPGAGKTTMLRYLGFTAATEQTLPIFVELRRLVRADGGLLDYVNALWLERYGEQGAAELVDHALVSGTAVLLIDGLDEVLGGESADEADATYQRVVQEIDRLAARYPNARIAVTCRRAGWRGQLPTFRTLEVLDFDDSQIDQFIQNWFEDDQEKAHDLTLAMRRSSRIQTLSANPLLLSLIAIVFESDLELPERRSKLYARTIEVLLSEWDSKRDIKRFPRFTADRKRDLLEEIAWHFQRRGLAYFPQDELLDMIAEFLPSIDLDPAEAPAILREIVEHYGMLKEQAHEVYGFLHLTLQEYFAAEVAARIGPAAIEEIARVRHDPWWEEVILLLAGQLRDATPLLLALLGRDQHTAEVDGWLALDDDLFHNDLLLTARCLISTPRIKAGWLRGRIVTQVGELMLTAPHESVHEQATQLFAAIGTGQIAQFEPRLKDLDPARRKAVAGALGLAEDDSHAAVPDFVTKYYETFDDVDMFDQESAPLILEWLDRLVPYATDGGSDLPLRQLIGAAGRLQLDGAVPTLWKLHDRAREHSRADHVLGACRDALIELGEIKVVELWELLDRQYSTRDSTIVPTLARHSEMSKALDAIIDVHTDPYHVRQLAAALKEGGESDLIAPVLDLLRDESIPWPTRWVLTEVLEQTDADAELLNLSNDQRAHPMIRIGAAATLTTRGRQEGVALLLAALHDHDLDDIARSGNPHHRLAIIQQDAEPLMRVLGCLARSDDPGAIIALFARFEHYVAMQPPTPDSPDLLSECDILVDVLAEPAAEEITRRLAELLEGLPTITDWVSYRSLLDNLRRTLPASLTAEILRRARALDLPVAAAEDARLLVERIAEVGEDPETVQELMKIVGDPGRIWDRDSALAALAQVGKRARVRIFPDGRVE